MKNILLCACLVIFVAACAPATPTPFPTATGTAPSTVTPTVPAAQASETAAYASIHATSTAQIATLIAAPRITPRPTLVPGIRYRFDDKITSEQRTLVASSIELGRKYFGDVWNVTAYVFSDFKSLCDAYIQYDIFVLSENCNILQSRGGQASAGAIFLNASSWQRLSTPLRIRIIIHEYIHVVQIYNTNRRRSTLELPSLGAPWLSEGSAEFLSTHVLYSEGLYDVSLIRNQMLAQAKRFRDPLNQFEIRPDVKDPRDQAEYSLGFLATEFLISNYGGQENIMKYYETMGRTGQTWQVCFTATFGISIDEFYARFEEYRQKNFPPN